MATNSRLFGLFLAFFLFPGLFSVSAQNSGYFIDTESGEPRFVQRLAWSGGEYALRYEVIIENSSNGTYRNYHREFTAGLYIDISLHPGSYRFRVIPYDILNRPGAASAWKYIEVLAALRPEPAAVLPEYVTGEPSGFLLNITGKNLDPQAEIFIRRADGTRIAAQTLDSGGGNIRAFVESGVLISGEYEIVIRNPGGLEASIVSLLLPVPEIEVIGEEKPVKQPEQEQEEISFPLKPIISNVGLTFMSSFPVYGDYIKDGMSAFGFSVYANTLFYVPIGVYIGPELSVLFLLTNNPDEFTMMVGSNLLVRKWFQGRRAALSFRMGVDYGIFFNWVDQVSIKMDISLLCRITNDIFMECGLNYSHLVSGISEGFFRPWFGIGYQF